MQRICGEEGKHEYLDQIFLCGNAGLHGLADDRTWIYGSGAEQDEERQET